MPSDFDSLPTLLSSSDLVEIGLYRDINAAFIARKRGLCPDFIKLKRKILYKKSSVLDFIEQHTHKGSINTILTTEQPSLEK